MAKMPSRHQRSQRADLNCFSAFGWAAAHNGFMVQLRV